MALVIAPTSTVCQAEIPPLGKAGSELHERQQPCQHIPVGAYFNWSSL